MSDHSTILWLVFAATLVLIVTGCPRKAAPMIILALLALLILLT